MRLRILACAAAALLPTLAARGAESPPPVRPNVIFILADDLGYGDLGCYGQTNFATPRLDRMAAEGLRFTQHYAGSTVCAPSRACLLTGLHTGHVFQRINGRIEFRPDPADVAIARLLQRAGYRTALIGKSGLSSSTANGRLPNEKGFDEFFGFTSHSRAHAHYPRWLWRNGVKEFYPGNHRATGDRYAGDMFRDEALAFIEANRAGPFFLHLAFTQPHADLAAPERWIAPFRGKFAETPFPGNGYHAQPEPKAAFCGMVAHLDDAVGRVLDKLRELDIDDRTLVFFSSDNGAMSEGGWSRDNFNSSGALRGGKRDLYEGGVRVPLIAWWPGRIAPGRTTDCLSAFWDFAPTACDLAGVAAPRGLDGASLKPTLLNAGDQPLHDYLYWEFYEQGGKRAVRRGAWKLVRLDALQPEPRDELYNLARDPGETTDLAAEQPEQVAALAALLDEAHEDEGPFRFP